MKCSVLKYKTEIAAKVEVEREYTFRIHTSEANQTGIEVAHGLIVYESLEHKLTRQCFQDF